MRKLLFTGLFLVIGFVLNSFQPTPASANCYYNGDPDYPACAQGAAMGSSRICLDAGIGYACCTNRPVLDTCPPLNSLTPTPTINPTGPCGQNSRICCSGGTCLEIDNTCVPIPRYQPICLNNYQISLMPGMIAYDPFCTLGQPDSGIATAIGCIPSQLKPFITTVLQWGIGLAGGIVMIVLGLAAITITTAAGDAKKVKAGQEMVTAAIGGIILIVFSVLILNFIGVNILNIGPLGFIIN